MQQELVDHEANMVGAESAGGGNKYEIKPPERLSHVQVCWDLGFFVFVFSELGGHKRDWGRETTGLACF